MKVIILLTRTYSDEWNSWGLKSERFAVNNSKSPLRYFGSVDELLDELLAGKLGNEIGKLGNEIVIWLNGYLYQYDHSEGGQQKDNRERAVKVDMPEIIGILKKAEVIIAHHAWKADLVDKNWADFTSTDQGGYNLLKELKRDGFGQKFEEAWVYLEGRKKKPTLNLSSIKHHIAQYFLSMDIDLGEILALWDSDQKDEAEEYLAEVLWGKEGKIPKSSNYYLEKLHEIRKYAGLKDSKSSNVKKIVEEQGLEQRDEWKWIQNLLGADKAKRSLLYPFLEFLQEHLLRAGIGKSQDEQKRILDREMESFVDYARDLKKCWDKTRSGDICDFDACFGEVIGKKSAYSVQDWLRALDEALAQLRDIVSESKVG